MSESPSSPARARRSRHGLLGRPRQLWRFLRNPDAPRFPKLMAIFAVLYTVWPVDLIPDFAPVVGWLDDLGVLAAGSWWLMRQAERYGDRRTDPPVSGSERDEEAGDSS